MSSNTITVADALDQFAQEATEIAKQWDNGMITRSEYYQKICYLVDRSRVSSRDQVHRKFKSDKK